MPKCLHCIRSFPNREALHQHLRSSGVKHPFCQPCDRRFISQEACNEHMTARHPPTFPCTKCKRTFGAQFALDDHFRGSPTHPNCAKCGRGFDDIQARDEHYRQEHPQVECLCKGVFIYKDSLEQHYKTSPLHPNCIKCGQGFKNDVELQQHNLDSSAHQECVLCKLIFKNHDEYRRHKELGHPCHTLPITSSPVHIALPKTASPVGATPDGSLSTTTPPKYVRNSAHRQRVDGRSSSGRFLVIEEFENIGGHIIPPSAPTPDSRGFQPDPSTNSSSLTGPIIYSTSSHSVFDLVAADGLRDYTADLSRIEIWRPGSEEFNANVSAPSDRTQGVGRFRDHLEMCYRKERAYGTHPLVPPSPEMTRLWSAMRNTQLPVESLGTTRDQSSTPQSLTTAATVESFNDGPVKIFNVVPSRPATARGSVRKAFAPQSAAVGARASVWWGAGASASEGRSSRPNMSENGKGGSSRTGTWRA